MIKIGYMGVGWIADWHIDAMRRCEGVEVVGAATGSSNRERFLARCDGLGIRGYDSIEALCCDPEIDAIAVLSPTGFHFDQCLKALDQGKHLLVEKPLFLDPAEYGVIRQHAEAKGCVVMPAHNFVHRPVVRKAKELIDSGALGTISYVSCRAVHFIPEAASSGWRQHHTVSGGGAMMDSGMHLVYQLLYLLGAPQYVSAFKGKHHYTHLEDEDVCLISMELEQGVIASVFQSWASSDASAGEIRVEGTQANLVISDALYLDGKVMETDAEYKDSFYHLAMAFHQAVEQGVPPISGLDDAETAFRLILSAYDAAETKRVHRFA